MTSRLAFQITGGLLTVALAGCEASKSSNPTAPTVAGPIPGVNISAPALIEPAQGFKFKENEQPIRLVVQNATTSGVRPLTYTFEVAADSGFGSKVFSRSTVAPGENNRTSVQIDRLEIGRAYYWRAWAEDGANTGATATAGFEIYPKPAVNAPAPLSPINNEVVPSATPTLRARNATWVGPVGGLRYEFQIATDQAFSKLVYAGFSNEGAGETTFNSAALPASTGVFWRVRASDGESTSSWSATQGFRTPAAPAPGPGPGPAPGPGGGGTCALPSGPQIVACIANKYPDKRAPVGSLGQRQSNMIFLRDRIIEAGKCAGLNFAYNLKRGGPELSIDVVVQQRSDGNMGVDIAFDYDNYGSTLQLTWGEIDLFAKPQQYPAFSCSGV